MIKRILLIFGLMIAIVIISTGCQSAAAAPAEPTPVKPPDSVADLTKDEYDGITISVDVLERKAILPGNVFTATVVVENTGDKTVSFVQGSGSFEIPEAVFLYSDTLQTIIPSDHLGIMTMDFVTHELKPGESLVFKLNAMAIQPNPDFDSYTLQLFNEDMYIGDMDLSNIQDRFPSLVAADPGSYTMKAYFLYSLVDENGEFGFLMGPTGYAEAETIINIS